MFLRKLRERVCSAVQLLLRLRSPRRPRCSVHTRAPCTSAQSADDRGASAPALRFTTVGTSRSCGSSSRSPCVSPAVLACLLISQPGFSSPTLCMRFLQRAARTPPPRPGWPPALLGYGEEDCWRNWCEGSWPGPVCLFFALWGRLHACVPPLLSGAKKSCDTLSLRLRALSRLRAPTFFGGPWPRDPQVPTRLLAVRLFTRRRRARTATSSADPTAASSPSPPGRRASTKPIRRRVWPGPPVLTR